MTATADARQGQSWQQQASWRHIWAISWPVLLANITFPLVGTADTAVSAVPTSGKVMLASNTGQEIAQIWRQLACCCHDWPWRASAVAVI